MAQLASEVVFFDHLQREIRRAQLALRWTSRLMRRLMLEGVEHHRILAMKAHGLAAIRYERCLQLFEAAKKQIADARPHVRLIRNFSLQRPRPRADAGVQREDDRQILR